MKCVCDDSVVCSGEAMPTNTSSHAVNLTVLKACAYD
jgi:hypothetical protein